MALDSTGTALVAPKAPYIPSASSTPPTTSSPAVVTSTTAQNNLNNIKAQTTDLTNGIATQKATVDAANAAKTTADQQTKQQSTANDLATKEADTARMAADAKAKALAGASTPAPAYSGLSKDQALNLFGNNFTGLKLNPDGTYSTTAADLASRKESGLQVPTNYSTALGRPMTDAEAAQQKITDEQAQRDQASADLQAQAKTVEDTIAGIQSGSIPLTAGEQAQIDGLKAQFQTLINQQELTNKGASGLANVRGYQAGAAEYDPTFQTKTIGSIVTAGANKIADLNVKMASAVAQLTQSFKDNDIKAVKDAWDVYKTASTDRTNAIQKTIDDAQKAIKDIQDKKDAIQKQIDGIQKEAMQNGLTDPKTLQAISSATTVSDAMTLAGNYLQTGTGDLARYLAYKRQAKDAGITPADYDTWLAKDQAQQVKQKSAEAYATAYAQESAKSQFSNSPQNQQKLEQEYRNVILKELSNRSGGLGLQDAKVNQAIHLKALYEQYYDPKTGNYNIPTAQYAEMVLGLATLLAPAGTTSENDRAAIMSKTAVGDLKGALQYATGVPQNGNSQAIMKNLVDSIKRQGTVAEDLRDTYVMNLHGQVPTDLDPSRAQALEKSKLASFTNPSNDPTLQAGIEAKKAVDSYVTSNPTEAESIAKLYDVPGATDETIMEYLKANGKI